MKRFRLEQRYEHRDQQGVENWKIVRESDSYEALVQICPYGYRIVDNQTGKVVFQLN
jgi:hypothetical protein